MASATPLDQELATFQQACLSPIIDLRDREDFVENHLREASHFPVAQLISRMHELPKRDKSLRLYGNSSQLKKASRLLSDKNYSIEAVLLWSDDLKSHLAKLDLLEPGENSKRLWSPAPIVERFQNSFIDEQQIGDALDIGCGAGRDSVYLATKGWQVTAIDYLPGALDKASKMAANNGQKINCHLLDLEKSLVLFEQESKQFDLILVCRYLHRPLLPLLKKKVLPGGYIVYQTFMRGCEAFGSPKNPRFLLEEGELAHCFAEFEILLDEVEILSDGRPTNIFIARKKFYI